MRALLVIGVAAMMLLMAGCAQEEAQTATTGTVTSAEPTSIAVEHEPEAGIVEHEIRLTDDGFFPATIHVRAQDTLRLVFLLDEERFITIESLGIAEDVQATTLDLTFPEPGTYDLVCMDCEDQHYAELVAE